MKYDISHAIRNLYPNGAKFVQEGLEYSGLKWFDERPKPTEKEINDKIVELDSAEPLKLLRQERNRRLQETDWTQYRDVSLSNDSDWQTYRQSLRDLPQNFSPIIDIITEDGYQIVKEQTDWPEKPS